MTAQEGVKGEEVEEVSLEEPRTPASSRTTRRGSSAAKVNPWTPRPSDEGGDAHSISSLQDESASRSFSSSTEDSASQDQSVSRSSSSRSVNSGKGMADNLKAKLGRLTSFAKSKMRRQSLPGAPQDDSQKVMRIVASENSLQELPSKARRASTTVSDNDLVQHICITPSAEESDGSGRNWTQRRHSTVSSKGSASPLGPRDDSWEIRTTYPLLQGRLSFTSHPSERSTLDEIKTKPHLFFFSSDCQDQYHPFCQDFGPTSIAVVHSFVIFMKQKMEDPKLRGKHLVYYFDNGMQTRTNAAFLLSAFLMIELQLEPAEAGEQFLKFKPSPFIPFKHSGLQHSDFGISLRHCLEALGKAIRKEYYSFSTFSLHTYDTLEHPITGNITVVSPKLLAFRSPSDTRNKRSMVLGLCRPSSYVNTFKQLGVTAVVRLSEPELYNENAFTSQGIEFYDINMEDTTAPSMEQVERFLEICDLHAGKVAVHCLAGLGRTGTMCAAWLIKREGFSAKEAIAWVRLCRPGSIIGNQQDFLMSLESRVPRRMSMPKTEELSEAVLIQSLEALDSLEASDSKLSNVEDRFTSPSAGRPRRVSALGIPSKSTGLQDIHEVAKSGQNDCDVQELEEEILPGSPTHA